MTGMLDREAIAQLIENGRAQQLTSAQIADQIMALAQDPTWAKAMTHPLRAEILNLLRRDGPLSPTQATKQLDAPLGTLAYHFRELDKLGFIEVSEQIPRRGAMEHVYRLTTTPNTTNTRRPAARRAGR